MKWKRLYNESLDSDYELKEIIRSDPTDFALAIKSFMDGLCNEVNDYSKVFKAFMYISNPVIKKALERAYADVSVKSDD